MKRRTRGVAPLALATLFVAMRPAIAFAQSDAAAAQALFDAGKALMDKKKFAEACPKLAESQRLDPAGGTLVHLATCHEEEGKLATAWAEFREAMDIAKRDHRADREAFAKKHADALEGKVAHLKISVGADAPAGLEVKRDGVSIAKPSWATPLPVDRGEHAIEASAPGFRTWKSVTVVAHDGESASVTIPALEALPKDAVGPIVGPVTTPPERTWQRPAGFVVTGVGAAGIIVGAIFGLVAKSKHDDAKSQCTLGPAHDGCTTAAVSAEDSARGAGTLSTVAFIAGGALAAGGVILLLTAPSAASSKEVGLGADVSPLGATLRLRGRF